MWAKNLVVLSSLMAFFWWGSHGTSVASLFIWVLDSQGKPTCRILESMLSVFGWGGFFTLNQVTSIPRKPQASDVRVGLGEIKNPTASAGRLTREEEEGSELQKPIFTVSCQTVKSFSDGEARMTTLMDVSPHGRKYQTWRGCNTPNPNLN